MSCAPVTAGSSLAMCRLTRTPRLKSARQRPDSFPGLYRVAVTGLFSLGTGVNDDRGTISNTYNIVETFSMVAGKHSLRMGGEAVQYQLNRFNNFAVRGSLTFGSTSSAAATGLNANALSGIAVQYVQERYKRLQRLSKLPAWSHHRDSVSLWRSGAKLHRD